MLEIKKRILHRPELCTILVRLVVRIIITSIIILVGRIFCDSLQPGLAAECEIHFGAMSTVSHTPTMIVVVS